MNTIPNINEIENNTSKNVQYIKSINNEERKSNNSNSSFTDYTYNEQLAMINKLYLNYETILKTRSNNKENNDNNTNLSLAIQREITRKISGYKQQDIKNEIYEKELLINIEDILEKMVASKLKCLYCKCIVNIIYKCVREETQWTLDRVDNDLCHSSSNTIVSCLKCNLKRRNINKEKFLFTRNLKIKKMGQ
jgi:hypothetical protein